VLQSDLGSPSRRHLINKVSFLVRRIILKFENGIESITYPEND
jgi:hypothetical protein